MRKIPVTMATQHPDNACAWDVIGQSYIPNSEETKECHWAFSELGVEEYMWDWEGKFVDESVIERLYQNYTDYFRTHPIGKDKFLTFRIPNIWEQPSHRLPRAFMNILAAEEAAERFGFHTPPLFEAILPMCTGADQLIYLQQRFRAIAEATENIFEKGTRMKYLDLIPLFEEIETMAEADQELAKYVDFLESELQLTPEYLRVFIARSDPAMNAGLVPTIMALKSSVSAYHEFGKRRGIKIYPWVGGGSLPFRGGINPDNIEEVVEDLRGVYSVSIQSAFRYDYPHDQAKAAIQFLNKTLPANIDNYRRITPEERRVLKAFNTKAATFWKTSVEAIADTINGVAAQIPSRRERVQHIGIFGYARGVGKVKLPRAIKFTGSLYSLGVPPELIATGRSLRLAEEMGIGDLVRELYVNLSRDLTHAGKYLNRENLDYLCRQDDAWQDIRQDIEFAKQFIGQDIAPVATRHIIHRNLTSTIFHKLRDGQDIQHEIIEAAKLRKSIG